MSGISPTGFWLGHDVPHYHDGPLCAALCGLFGGASVLDLGCGDARYVGQFLKAGIAAFGVDGNPETPSWPDATHGRVLVADLSAPLNLPPRDWVLSLEVGEHLPPQYADTFLDNVVRHARRGVVLSWAVPGQGGHGHFNERANAWVRQQMAARGFGHDAGLTRILRAAATLPWFAESLMAFAPALRPKRRRNSAPRACRRASGRPRRSTS